MTFERWARVLGGLCLLGGLGAGTAAGQGLADLAKKEKERREKAGSTGAPAFSNDDLEKRPDSAETNASDEGSRSSRTTPPSDAEARSETWWRAQAEACREAIAEAEQAVKTYEALLEEARTGIRQPQPGDANKQLPPRVATDSQKRAAEYGLALARRQLAQAKKDMDALEDEARKKQILPGWLR
jgi:hypothetical protein